MSSARKLRMVMVTALVLAVLAGFYLVRCWQAHKQISPDLIYIDSNFFMSLSFLGELHFHKTVRRYAYSPKMLKEGDPPIHEEVMCVHLWKNERAWLFQISQNQFEDEPPKRVVGSHQFRGYVTPYTNCVFKTEEKSFITKWDK